MGTFQRCAALVIAAEGGDKTTDDPRDAGGLTRWGISQRFNPDVDVANLDRAGAEAVYRRKYWEPLRCDDLPNGLDLLVFDAAVVPGPGWTPRALQEVLRVRVDGKVGMETVMAAKRATPEHLARFTKARIEEFRHAVERNSNNLAFLDGWELRALRMFWAAATMWGS